MNATRNERPYPIAAKDLARFMARVKIIESGCWEWQGHLNFGYGRIRIGNDHIRVHRLSYQIHAGAIPDGLVIDHLCRNRSCVNPSHLEPVTSRENTLRGISKVAHQAKQTHCKRGHELVHPNLVKTKTGFRMCKACDERQGVCPVCGKQMRRANLRRHERDIHGI